MSAPVVIWVHAKTMQCNSVLYAKKKKYCDIHRTGYALNVISTRNKHRWCKMFSEGRTFTSNNDRSGRSIQATMNEIFLKCVQIRDVVSERSRAICSQTLKLVLVSTALLCINAQK